MREVYRKHVNFINSSTCTGAQKGQSVADLVARRTSNGENKARGVMDAGYKMADPGYRMRDDDPRLTTPLKPAKE
jgi:hypothetical protein